MLALIGACTIATVLAGIMSKRLSPLAALVLASCIGALAAGYSPTQTSAFVVEGLRSVIPVAGMIMFAILYFGVASDAGMLDPLITRIVRNVGCRPTRITMGTALLALIIHMDGSGAVTIMLTVPAMMPLYDRLGMDRRVLALIIAMSAGVNFLPWIGPMVRAAAVLHVPSVVIFTPLIPVQICGLIVMFTISWYFGKREEKRLKLHTGDRVAETSDYRLTDAQQTLRRPRNFWINLAITLAIIASMVAHVLDAVVAFMLGLVLALTVNYPRVDDQLRRIDAHAKPALMLGSILLGAGAFVGIMKNTGIITAMAQALVAVIPQGMEQHVPFVLGLVSMPLSLFFDPDSFYFGVMPVIAEAYQTLGGDPVQIARAALLGTYTTGFGVSPLTPSCFLLLGMTGIDLADLQRFCIPWLWACSIIMTIFAAAIGVFPF
jgi:CitMHS family citrate-Mg2+:H+ or citrate-Ca2+:H+ symporter